MKQRGFESVKHEMKKYKENIKLPMRGSKNSAGYDFYSPCNIIIEPHCTTSIIPTDVKAYMQDDEVLLLFIRSSIGIKKGLTLSNGTGVIDSDYYNNPDNDGNIGISLRNETDEIVAIKKGERIMQGVFIKYLVADNDNTTTERNGGFGSTGVK